MAIMLDHSSRPSTTAGIHAFAQAAKSYGASIIARYLDGPTANHPYKNLTREEVDIYHSWGLDVVAIAETDGKQGLTGYNGGLIQGRIHGALYQNLGAPPGLTIYYAECDLDLSTSQYPVCNDFIRGCLDATWSQYHYGVGGYGERGWVDQLPYYGWSAAGWVGSVTTFGPLVNFSQKIPQVTLAGVTCDINDVLHPEVGAWKHSTIPTPPPPPPRRHKMFVLSVADDGTGHSGQYLATMDNKGKVAQLIVDPAAAEAYAAVLPVVPVDAAEFKTYHIATAPS